MVSSPRARCRGELRGNGGAPGDVRTGPADEGGRFPFCGASQAEENPPGPGCASVRRGRCFAMRLSVQSGRQLKNGERPLLSTFNL